MDDDDGSLDWSQEEYIAMAYRQATTYGGIDLFNSPRWLVMGLNMYAHVINTLLEDAR